MKLPAAALALLLLAAAAGPRPAAAAGAAADLAAGSGGNPLQKVIQLMTELQGKVISDGEAEQRTYEGYVRWCGKSAADKKQEIKEGSALKEDLESRIEKAASDADQATGDIAQLSGSIATDEADLKAATLLREKERQDFEALDTELTSTIDTLGRARRVLQRELQKAGAASPSFLQKPTRGMRVFAAALQELVSAAGVLSGSDRARLEALLQGRGQGEEEDADSADAESLGAPSAAVYTSHSDGLFEALEDLQEKTEVAQADSRKKEQNERHNFELLKQSLQGKLEVQTGELADTKKVLAHAQEVKAQAEQELQVCVTDLKDAQRLLDKLQHDCMARASQFSEEVRTRKAELTALAQAKKAIQDQSGGAGNRAYSLLQMQAAVEASSSSSGSASRAAAAATAAVRKLRQLASHGGSLALKQLASRVAEAARSADASAEDPFVKVRGLIAEMIRKLQHEAKEEADQKEFCDREMGRTTKSKESKEDGLQEVTSRLETAAAEVARLQEEIKSLYREINEIAQSQAETDKLRQEEHTAYVNAKKDFEEGLRGVQTAIKVLRDYYGGGDDGGGGAAASLAQEDMATSMAEAEAGHQGQSLGEPGGAGAGQGIIGLLEVVESDFAKSLTEAESAEAAAEEAHAQFTQENKVTMATKEAEVKHKGNEVKRLRKQAAELASDRAESQQELDAINEYWDKLKPQCVKKSGSFSDRAERRKEEIQGLRDALDTLERSSAA